MSLRHKERAERTIKGYLITYKTEFFIWRRLVPVKMFLTGTWCGRHVMFHISKKDRENVHPDICSDVYTSTREAFHSEFHGCPEDLVPCSRVG